jgi:Icc-related predicted phosphoesterase
VKKGCSSVKIVVLADIHGSLEPLVRLEKPLSEADVILVAGDITNFGGVVQARAVLGQLKRWNTSVLAVAGNCDPPAVDACLVEAGVSLQGRAVCVNSWWFAGVGGALPDLGKLPIEGGERLFLETLEKAYAQCGDPARLVVVTHQPAWNTAMDAVSPGRHVGNRAIRAFIDKARPRLAVSGHIHEIIGSERLGPTTLVNPGPAKNGRYAEIDLDNNIHVRFF